MWINYNANPINKRVGDCTVRAISKVTGKSWEDVYIGLAVKGYMLCDMSSANVVWSAYLKDHGFTRNIIPDLCPTCYTVEDFCNEHPQGTFLLALQNHVVAVQDGNFFDTWDSGCECPIYYWQRKDD